MNRTPIPWVKNPDGTQGYTWNPITGCLNGCPYCYARKLANGRLFSKYMANTNVVPHRLAEVDAIKVLDPFYPRFWPERMGDLCPKFVPNRIKPRGIFVCDMGELFGDWVPHSWQERVFEAIRLHPEHRFYLLTKQPQNLVKFSPFPPNCYVGVTATNFQMFALALHYLTEIKASIKYISLEPYLDRIIGDKNSGFYNEDCLAFDLEHYLDWLIIGAVTGVKKDLIDLNKKYPKLALMPYGNKWSLQPSVEWVKEIVRACDKAAVPVFLKDNLMPLFCGGSHVAHGLFGSYEYVVGRKRGKGMEWKLRQEVPR